MTGHHDTVIDYHPTSEGTRQNRLSSFRALAVTSCKGHTSFVSFSTPVAAQQKAKHPTPVCACLTSSPAPTPAVFPMPPYWARKRDLLARPTVPALRRHTCQRPCAAQHPRCQNCSGKQSATKLRVTSRQLQRKAVFFMVSSDSTATCRQAL